MKRLLLAGILVLSLASIRAGARAESDDAYGSLVGMADSAAADRGPEAGEVPPDNAAMPARRRAEKPAAYASGAAAPKEEAKAPAVSVPPVASRRAWTRLFSALMPATSRPSSFEIALSTAPRKGRAKTAAWDTPASTAGTAQGMLELVAAATAPTAP